MRHGSWVGLALIGLLGGGVFICAQDEKVVGGFSKASVKDAEVIKAAKFAVAEKSKTDKGSNYKLEKIVAAKQQVVAGINYDLDLKVSVKGRSKDVLARVWKKLDGKYELSKWEEVAKTEKK